MAATHTLKGFVDEIIEVLEALPGDNYIPESPVANPGTFPFGTVYQSESTMTAQPAGLVATSLNDVTVVWLVPFDDLARPIEYMLPLKEEIEFELIKRFIKNDTPNSSHVQHPFISVTMVLGPIEWANVEMFGWLITLNGAKVQNEV